MKTPNLLILLIILFLTSCSLLERRDFISEMDNQYEGQMFQANRDFMVVPGDTGRAHRTRSEIRHRTPATLQDQEFLRYNSSLNQELISLENKLSDDEYESYLKYKDKLGGTSEKIYFLGLNSRDRNQYLMAKNIKDQNNNRSLANVRGRANYYRSNAFSTESAMQKSFPKINDVALGMSKDDVLQNWGQPERRDVAGNPDYENERWAYRKDGTVKYIYFESGQVEGWTEH